MGVLKFMMFLFYLMDFAQIFVFKENYLINQIIIFLFNICN